VVDMGDDGEVADVLHAAIGGAVTAWKVGYA
jgi:hypothetical protein